MKWHVTLKIIAIPTFNDSDSGSFIRMVKLCPRFYIEGKYVKEYWEEGVNEIDPEFDFD